jgi:alkanesulfonate monooxygenase SsuD/methylene tetrahydromethanopterin reductase-like flavin-dependent oxidoreductase (luciferase family)
MRRILQASRRESQWEDRREAWDAHRLVQLGRRRTGAQLGEIVEAAEAAGFDTVTVVEHLWQHPYMGGRLQPMLEAYSTLSWIAAHTKRVRLLSLATAASTGRRDCSPSW